jgi:fumarate reductase subunit D
MTTIVSARTAIRRNDLRAHGHPGYWAFVVHRVSGIALALFLPVHFFVLSLALSHRAGLDSFLGWTRQPSVKAAETLLVLALAAHLAGGVRLLFVEFVGWRAEWQKTLIALVAAAAIACALLFALNA